MLLCNTLLILFSLTDLQKQLTSILPKHNENNNPIKDYKLSFDNQKQDRASNHSSYLGIKNEGEIIVSKPTSITLDVPKDSISKPTMDVHIGLSTNSIPNSIEGVDTDATKISNSIPTMDANIEQKRRRDPIIAMPAWSYSEVLLGMLGSLFGLIVELIIMIFHSLGFYFILFYFVWLMWSLLVYF